MIPAPSTPPVVERAPAKVNLALHVVGRRADGYHLLDTLAAFPDVADVVTVRRADAFSLAIVGPGAGALAGEADESNLVLRAARAFAEAFEPGLAVDLTLEKTLPVAAGLGGGSADAAATLRALCRLTGRALDHPGVGALALRLGADVPMCLAMRPVRATGVGEVLEPWPWVPRLGIVLVNPGVPVSTPAVFRALARRDNPALPVPGPDRSADAFVDWLSAGRNDLQPAAIALEPAIAGVLDRLSSSPDCLFARMSGSGATCFALTRDAASAGRLAAAVKAAEPAWWTAAALLDG